MAAVIGEPISATPVIPSRGWKGVKQLCEQYGALLVFDEIIEGFGRTGKMFACEHFVILDVLVLGKSFGGLVPFAGIVTHENIMFARIGPLVITPTKRIVLSSRAGRSRASKKIIWPIMRLNWVDML